MPAWQVVPPVQAIPHVPQLPLSPCRFTQLPLQSVNPGMLQPTPHWVPSQVAAPPWGAGHAVHEVVPQLLVSMLLTHVPPQLCMPLGQAHLPA